MLVMKMVMTTDILMELMNEIKDKLSTIKGVSFVSVDYVNQDGDHELIIFNIGVDYQKAKQKDLEMLYTLDVWSLTAPIPNTLLEDARLSLIDNLEKPNKAIQEGLKNAFTSLGNGFKIHNETGELYVYGMLISKYIKSEGAYREDTRKPLTVAKDYLRGMMKHTQYRQFKINNAKSFTVKGNKIIIE